MVDKIRCYKVSRMGIEAVDVRLYEWVESIDLFRSIVLARELCRQKPRVPSRAADWEVVG